MQEKRIILRLLALGLLLSGCAQRPTSAMPDILTGTGSSTGEIIADSPNERTPVTVDSLEVVALTGAILETSISASGTMIIGDAGSRHRLIIFSDYDCTYCRQVDRIPTKDGLTVERVFLPMSIAGEQAASLALCAAEQQKFPEADEWLNSHEITGIDRKNFAKVIGLNLQKLTLCMAKKNLLEGNLQKASEYSVERVPFFVLGSDSWLGLLPKEELQKRIEKNTR